MISNEKKHVNLGINYQFFIENINDLICIVGPKKDFKIEYINEHAFLTILGYTSEDLFGNSILNYIHTDDVRKTVKILKKIAELKSISQEIRIKNRNNKYIWFELKARKFIDYNLQKKSLLILKDISERKGLEDKIEEIEVKIKELTTAIPEIRFWKLFYPKKFEEALRTSYEMLQMVMENIPQYIFWKDTNLDYLGCNSNYAKLLGAETPENIIGKTDKKLLWNKQKINEIREEEIYVMNSEKAEIHRVEPWVLKSGEEILMDTNRISLHDSEGNIVGILVTHEDVTERKLAEHRLKESEEKYRDLLETSSVGILEVDLTNKNLTYINPKLVNILGYEREQLNSERFLAKITHPEDFKKFFRISDEKELEFRIYDKDGKLKWLSGNKVNNYNENGELLSVRFWLEDVTEKKMYENLIYELNINFLNFTTDIQKNIEMLLETCRKLLNAEVVLYTHKGVYEGKEQYQIISNDKKVFIYDSEEFNNNHFVSELFNEEHDIIQCVSDIDETKYVKTDPYIIVYKAKGCYGKLIKSQNEFNSAICVLYSENPILSDQDKLVIFLIADAIEIEQRRWQVQQHLEDQNRLKTELFSRTSHELKTPLISIKGFTELLLTVHRSKFDIDTILVLEEINKGSERLEKTINSLLKSSKLDQDQLKLNKTKEDLSFLIKFCVQEMQGLAELRKQTINLNIHDELITRFDKERMYEVISNILVNAIKYTPPGGNVIIQSEIDEKEKAYIIAIKDNGIGITEEEKDLIFRPFGKIERYGKGWDVEIEGSGLGLYISKKIIKLHDGNIWIESEGRDKGSAFYFSIPIISK